MSKRTRIIALVCIIIIATFLRFYHLTTTPPGLYPDEAMDGANAQYAAHTDQLKVYYPEDNGREGLYVNILAIAFKFHLLPETAPWAVRFPAAVAGVLTVWGVYLLVAELFRDREEGYAIALLAAFFLATSFWHINFSRIGFRAILAPLLLTWSLYFLIKSFRAKAPKGAKHSSTALWYAIAAGVVYGLGFYTYIAYRVTPLLLLVFLPFFKKDWRFWQRAIVFLVATFIAAAPIGWYFAKNPADFFGRTSEISVTSAASPLHDLLVNVAKTALMFNVQGDGNWRQNVSGAPQIWFPVGILFLFGIVLAIIWASQWFWPADNRRKGDGSNSAFAIVLALAWFVLGLLPEVFSDEGIPHALRSLLAVVPCMIFAAIAAVWLYNLVEKYFQKMRWRRMLLILIAACFLAEIGIYGYYDYFVTWAQNPNVPGAFSANYVAIGDAINALPPTLQKYVVVQAGGVIDYGIPVPAMTVMYVTDSFVPDAVAQKDVNNIHYLLPNEIDQIPPGTPADTIFYIK